MSAYLRELERYGITANDVAAPGCYSFDLAAWRLRMHLRNDKGDIWTRAANYHSRTPQFNTVYRADLMKKAAKWADWLEARFVTLDVTKEDATPSTPTMKAEGAANLRWLLGSLEVDRPGVDDGGSRQQVPV